MPSSLTWRPRSPSPGSFSARRPGFRRRRTSLADEYQLILAAGIDDWGGVSPLTPDHVNPERPWPQIDDLAAQTAAGGFQLAERLTIYPNYIREPWLDPRLARHVAALADPATGLARAGAQPSGLPWQEPDGGWGSDGGWGASGRTDLFTTIDTAGRTRDRRDDFAEVYGDWDEVGARIDPAARQEAAAREAEAASAQVGAAEAALPTPALPAQAASSVLPPAPGRSGRHAAAGAGGGARRAARRRARPGRDHRCAGARAAGRRRAGARRPGGPGRRPAP